VKAVPVWKLEGCKGSTFHLEPELGATVIMYKGLKGWQDQLV
jgi:hypothetical protein